MDCHTENEAKQKQNCKIWHTCSTDTIFSFAATRSQVKRCISDKTPAKPLFVISLFLTLRNIEGESIIMGS
jgi:hypothetical protein